MCGIAGYLSAADVAEPRPLDGLLSVLRTELGHRGPDDSGVWQNPGCNVGLVHTRLAILDLSPLGHQPMSVQAGRFTITFNGEIYNFKELRQELTQQGCQFRTGTDTEVLLAMYQHQGAACVNQLRGMFAFCIWDELEQTAFLARDPMGIKPLYYALRPDGSLVFASELKALQRSKAVGDELDGTALIAYFENGSVPEPLTLLKHVFSLEAGCSLLWRQGQLQRERYWQLQFQEPQPASPEDGQQVREALLDSLRHHFISDVPVGIFLSGGIDSTALVALAQVLGHEAVNTFCIGVNDAVLDESSTARETAALFGTQHQEYQLTGAAAQAGFADFLQCGDQPSIDGFNTFIVSRFAKQCGMKVVLSGVGGDELFGGYPSFQAVPRLVRLSRLAHRLSPASSSLGCLLERFGQTPRSRRLGTMLQRPPGILSAYRAFRGVFSYREARILASRYVSDLPAEDTCGVESRANELNHVSELELTRYMRNQLLKDGDVMSMAHGLELRVPLVDRTLFERVSRVPTSQRLRHGKAMLLDAVPEVPAHVANARKRGFMFPFERWLQVSWGTEFEIVSRSMPAANAAWYQRWCLFAFEHWLQRK